MNAAFVARMEDMLAVYERPHAPRFPVVCFDERPCVLHGQPTAPRPPVPAQPAVGDQAAKAGRPRRASSTKEKIKELWREDFWGFFPKGTDDPNLALIRVDIESGEYRDTPGNVLVRAFAYLKARTTGEKHQPTPDKQAKVLV